MARITEVAVRDLQAGDKVLDKGRLVYTVLDVIRDEPSERIARIEWLDGGRDFRAWDPEHFDQRIDIARED